MNAGKLMRAIGSIALCLLIVEPSLKAQDPDRIVAIEVQGLSRLTQETVLFRTGLKIGDDAKEIDFSKILQLLWATKIFDDIKIELEDFKDGKKIILRLVERPIVKEVDYRGGTEIGLTSIKDKIKEKKLDIKVDAPYDPEAARKAKDLIVDLAAEKGFQSPSIEVKLEPLGNGLSRLLFDIKEGGKTHIYSVNFKGNKVFSSKELKSLMAKTRENWIFSFITSHDLLVDKNLQEDIESIRKAYWKKGYKDVFIGSPSITIDDFTTPKQKKANEKLISQARSPKYDLRAALNFQVVEGDRFLEGTFKVEGNELFFDSYYLDKYEEFKRNNQSAIAKFLDLKPSPKKAQAADVLLDLDAINQTIDKIKEGYGDQGYILARLEKVLVPRETDGKKYIDITLKIEEGEKFTIRNLNFSGNTFTKDKVLRRSFLLREGDVFSREMFKDSMLRISQLSFFDIKTSEPKVDLVPEKSQVDIVVKGEEAGVNEFLFNGGYGPLFGFSLGVSFSTKNFGGGGDSLSVNINSGQFQKSLSIGYMQPFVFDLPYSFSANIFNSSTDYDASRVGTANAYRESNKGLGVGVGSRLSNFFKTKQWAYFTEISLGYNYRLVAIDGGYNYFFRNINEQLTSNVSFGIQFNTIDNPFKPTRGLKLAFSAEYGGWQFGGDRPTLRSSWDITHYFTIGERNIFGTNLNYGYLRDLSGQGLQIFNFFRPGGENSIRGYRYGQVGSIEYDPYGQPVIVGGNKQFIFNIEYAFKIADQFRFVIFYDAGNAWSSGRKVFSEALRQSYGLEFRFFLPISPAPMRLIWSQKMNPYLNDPYGKSDFQFSIGTTF